MSNLIFLGLYFSLVVLPVVIWLIVFLFWDRKEPEPRNLIAKLFLLSVVAVLLAIGLEELFDRILFSSEEIKSIKQEGMVFRGSFPLFLFSFFLAGPIEELTKYLVLKRTVFKSSHFSQVADGVIYGVALALGFALVENTGYFFDIYPKIFFAEGFLFAIIFRGLATMLLHVATTGIMGLYLGRAKFSKKHWIIILKGVILASLAHGSFNVLIFLPSGTIINIFLVLFLMGYLIYQLKTKESQKIRQSLLN